jgi:hypothetical protein
MLNNIEKGFKEEVKFILSEYYEEPKYNSKNISNIVSKIMLDEQLWEQINDRIMYYLEHELKDLKLKGELDNER